MYEETIQEIEEMYAHVWIVKQLGWNLEMIQVEASSVLLQNLARYGYDSRMNEDLPVYFFPFGLNATIAYFPNPYGLRIGSYFFTKHQVRAFEKNKRNWYQTPAEKG